MNRQETDLSRADTMPTHPVVHAPKRGDDMDTIPPDQALEADLIALQADLTINLPIEILTIRREGDTVIVEAKSTIKNASARETEDRFLCSILHYYRGITIYGNTFIFNVQRGGRTQKISLTVA